MDTIISMAKNEFQLRCLIIFVSGMLVGYGVTALAYALTKIIKSKRENKKS